MSKDERDLQFMYLLGRADAMETARAWQALRDFLNGVDDGEMADWQARCEDARGDGYDDGYERGYAMRDRGPRIAS
jgi:hypothetical protein